MTSPIEHDTGKLDFYHDPVSADTGRLDTDQLVENDEDSLEDARKKTSIHFLSDSDVESMQNGEVWSKIYTIIQGLENSTATRATTDGKTRIDYETMAYNEIKRLIDELQSFGCEIVYSTIWNHSIYDEDAESNFIFNNSNKKFEVRFHPNIFTGTEPFEPSIEALKAKLIELFRQRTIVLYILKSVKLKSFPNDGRPVDSAEKNPKNISDLNSLMSYKKDLEPAFRVIFNQLQLKGFPQKR